MWVHGVGPTSQSSILLRHQRKGNTKGTRKAGLPLLHLAFPPLTRAKAAAAAPHLSPGRSPGAPCLHLGSHDWFTDLHVHGLLERPGTERRHHSARCGSRIFLSTASSGVLGPKGGTFRRDAVREEVQNDIC